MPGQNILHGRKFEEVHVYQFLNIIFFFISFRSTVSDLPVIYGEGMMAGLR